MLTNSYKKKEKFGLYIVIFICMLLLSCSFFARVDPKHVKDINLNLTRQQDVKMNFKLSENDGMHLMKLINDSNNIYTVLFIPKEILTEGEYRINITYKNKKVDDIFTINKTEYLFWENEKQWLKNKEVLVFIRGISKK